MKALWNKAKTWLNTNNHLLWVSIIALIIIGLMVSYFVGPYSLALHHWWKYFPPHYFFHNFWQFVLLGIIILFAFSKLSKKWVIRISWILGIFALFLILKAIIAPMIIHGSARFVMLGWIGVHPYTVMLPAYIVLMSHWLSNEKANRTWTTIGTAALTLFIIYAAFVAPHMFMVMVYLSLFIIMTFRARKNIPGAFYTSIGILIAFVAFMALLIWHSPHLQHRIMNLDNYATQMSVQAITNSALVGSTTESLTALSKIPGSVTDFAFTGMIAKFGILMGLLILALYGCVAKGLVNTIRNTKDKFNKMLFTGTLWVFAIYVIMALAEAFGLQPAATYWPFIGYGGLPLLTWCGLFGFVLAVNKSTDGVLYNKLKTFITTQAHEYKTIAWYKKPKYWSLLVVLAFCVIADICSGFRMMYVLLQCICFVPILFLMAIGYVFPFIVSGILVSGILFFKVLGHIPAYIPGIFPVIAWAVSIGLLVIGLMIEIKRYRKSFFWKCVFKELLVCCLWAAYFIGVAYIYDNINTRVARKVFVTDCITYYKKAHMTSTAERLANCMKRYKDPYTNNNDLKNYCLKIINDEQYYKYTDDDDLTRHCTEMSIKK